MSVVIRLQNLPLSAKSADIRNFFGGLRIPSGGVHIIGGEKGEAFIAFNSDEDARLAMRKDGGKIKDSRVKLILSSRMEMQYEVEKITKNSQCLQYPPKPEREPSADLHQKHPGRTYGSETYRRSRSPSASGGVRKSRSPRRRGQSRRSRSPSSKDYFLRGERAVSRDRELNSAVSQTADSSKAISEIQAQLEKRIAEAIESNPILMSRYSDSAYGTASESSASFTTNPSELMYAQNQQTVPLQSPNYSGEFSSESSLRPETYYVSLSGLDPYWDFLDIRAILRPIYVSRDDFCLERDNRGERTGSAIIRLTDRNDFETLMRNRSFVLYNRLITINECYPSLASQYFNLPPKENRDLCYLLKGLPFACTYDNVVTFFSGCEVADVVIFYDDFGKATGLGYVSFTNERDFKAAYLRNKQFILNRFIQMFPCTDKDMAEAKESISKKVADSLVVKKNRRTLCALITGLPSFTSVKKLTAFLEESGVTADGIHLTLNRKKCDGRAFIEFINFRDFDLALKLNGTKFQNLHAICVKQILYDEMVRILEGQKAKHHYNNPDLSLPESEAKAEKVPYLWEPPDAAEEEAAKEAPASNAKRTPRQSTETSLSPPNNSTRTYASRQDQSYFSVNTSLSSRNNSTSVYAPPQDQSHFSPDTSLSSINNSTSTYALTQSQSHFSPDTSLSSINNSTSTYALPQNQSHFSPDTSLPPPISAYAAEQSRPHFSVDTSLPPPNHSTSAYAPPQDQLHFSPVVSVYDSIVQQPMLAPPPVFDPALQFPPPVQPFFPPPNNFVGGLPEMVPPFAPFQDNFSTAAEAPLTNSTQATKQNFNRNAFRSKYRVLSQIPLQNKIASGVEAKSATGSAKLKFSADDAALIKGSSSKDPIKFNVKKASGVSAKKNETFASEGSTDKKVKLSKLSPPKDLEQKQPEGKEKAGGAKIEAVGTKQEAMQKEANEKPKTPDTKKETEKKHTVKDNKKIKNKSSRQNQPKKPMSYQRKSSGSRLSPTHQVPCVVQLSNISLDVKTQDLVDFLHGFTYDPSSIIRRYTESGEPTGDVRVSFLNRKEAETAIKNLQGCYLRKLQVKMFIV